VFQIVADCWYFIYFSSSFSAVFGQAPTVVSLSPDFGGVGTTVTINIPGLLQLKALRDLVDTSFLSAGVDALLDITDPLLGAAVTAAFSHNPMCNLIATCGDHAKEGLYEFQIKQVQKGASVLGVRP
jgi:hypothetical protein